MIEAGTEYKNSRWKPRKGFLFTTEEEALAAAEFIAGLANMKQAETPGALEYGRIGWLKFEDLSSEVLRLNCSTQPITQHASRSKLAKW